MKYATTKNIEAQINVIEQARKRLGKVAAELRELSTRDWKGGELEMAGLTKSALTEVTDTLDKLRAAEKPLQHMRTKCIAKDKARKK